MKGNVGPSDFSKHRSLPPCWFQQSKYPGGEATWISLPPSFHFPIRSLTSTDAPGHRHIVAVITLQPFVVVTRPCGAAVLVKLRRAHLAAPTSICHGADTRWAHLRLCGALTHCRAASSHLGRRKRHRNLSHAMFTTAIWNPRALFKKEVRV